MSITDADRQLIALTIRDERTLACPICDYQLDVAPVPMVPAVADALGISARGLAEIHAGQEARRAVYELRHHLEQHSVVDWVQAVVSARSGFDDRRAAEMHS